MNKYLKIGIMLLVVGIVASAAYAYSSPVTEQNTNNIQEVQVEQTVQTSAPIAPISVQKGPGSVSYKGHVEVSILRAATGERTIVADKDNLITTGGVNFIRDKINGLDANTSNRTLAISLAMNGTTPAAGWTQISDELTTLGFVRNTTGSYETNGTGAYVIRATWTASGTQDNIQLTGLHWQNLSASNNNLFAALQFTNQSLLTNDQLQINWSIFIS